MTKWLVTKRKICQLSMYNIIIKPQLPDFLDTANKVADFIGNNAIIEKVEEKQPAQKPPALSAESIELFIRQNGISAQFIGKNAENPIYIDFCSKKMLHRQKNVTLKNELIAKATGIKSNNELSVFDATAGLGCDSFIMASLGAKITATERNKIIYLLLEDALKRASNNYATANIKLIFADATRLLNHTNEYDVVYMDPMFPKKTKTALNKKEMRFFKDVVGKDGDASSLFELALNAAKKRVVVKRPLHAEYISDKKPSFQIKGKANRFDVYVKL